MAHRYRRALRRSTLPALTVLAALLQSACNDLTEPLPGIAGTYQYLTSSPVPPLSRRGTVTFVDDDRRTARFDGTFEYIDARGRQVSGPLTGAFMQPDRIWFRFQDENLVIHEGDLLFGFGSGEIFFQGLTYETTGATYSLRVR